MYDVRVLYPVPYLLIAEIPNSRREILQKGAAIASVVAVPAAANAYEVPDLLYPFEALEPYIDAPTMKIHHDKHHATYVANINKATEGKDAVDILDLQLNALEAGPAVRNNAGGHYNHAFFWDEMAPPDEAKKMKPSDALAKAIDKSFGSFDDMKAKFEAQAAPGEYTVYCTAVRTIGILFFLSLIRTSIVLSHTGAVFGSGWVWVCLNGDKLEIVGTPNQDNPLMKGVKDSVMFPILGLDVWEHAYYLKYQNRRPEYVSNWWNVVNWDKVSENYAYVTENKAGVPVRN